MPVIVKLNLMLAVLLVLLLAGVAMAQSLTNPSSWKLYATDPLAYIGVLIVITEFLKSHVLSAYITRKWETIGLVLALGVIGRFLFWIPAGWVQHDAVVSVVTGLFYGICAAGLAKFASGLFQNAITGPIVEKLLTALVGPTVEAQIKKAVEDYAAQNGGDAGNSSGAATPPPTT